jgi:hypothetical protein
VNLPETAHPRCIDCSLPVDTDSTLSLQEVLGFAKRRRSGGQNHVLFRTETGRWLCPRCVVARRHRIHPEQESLL